MICSPSEGAAAVVLARGDRAADLCERPVRLAAVAKRTRRFGSFEVFAPWLPPEAGQSPSVDAGTAVFTAAGIAPPDSPGGPVPGTHAGGGRGRTGRGGGPADERAGGARRRLDRGARNERRGKAAPQSTPEASGRQSMSEPDMEAWRAKVREWLASVLPRRSEQPEGPADYAVFQNITEEAERELLDKGRGDRKAGEYAGD